MINKNRIITISFYRKKYTGVRRLLMIRNKIPSRIGDRTSSKISLYFSYI